MRRSFKDKTISGMRIVKDDSGFTIVELVVSMIILAVLITISISIYLNYISKARVTVANSILYDARRTLVNYEMDNGRYPASIDFTTCSDELGSIVFPPALCEQIKEELYSVESYSLSDKSYVLTVRAKDNKHTLLTLTEGKITIQGI